MRTVVSVAFTCIVAGLSLLAGCSEDDILIPVIERLDTTVIRDYQYAEGRIFDLGYPPDTLGLGHPGDFNRLDSVVQLLIFGVDVADSVINPFCRLLVDPGDSTLFYSQRFEGRFIHLHEDTYRVYQDLDRGIHAVVFDSSHHYPIGAWYVVRRWDSVAGAYSATLDTIGDLNPSGWGDPKILKQLRGVQRMPTDKSYWLAWRNVYTIPKGFRPENLNIDVYKGLAGSEGTANSLNYQIDGTGERCYLEILGLDQVNRSDIRIPDRLVDDWADIYRPDWGLLIFPHRLPFASDTTYGNAGNHDPPPLAVKVPFIYRSASTTGRAAASKYFIQYVEKVK